MKINEIINEADWSKETIDWSKVRPEFHAGVDEPTNRAEILAQKQAFDRSTGHINKSNIPPGEDVEGQKLVKWQWDIRKELQPKFKEKMQMPKSVTVRGGGGAGTGDPGSWKSPHPIMLGTDLDPVPMMQQYKYDAAKRGNY